MQAFIYAVREFLPRLRSWVVRLICDNAVTVAYIKNEGGGGHQIAHFDADDHTAAQVLRQSPESRVGQTLTTEWTMTMESLRPVFAKWG